MKYIFFSFPGWPEPPMQQRNKIFKIDINFECWNLKKFSANDFLNTIKKKIPPINENVLSLYSINTTTQDRFNEELYKDQLWGLLVPEHADSIAGSHREILALINLFSPIFMHPSFLVTDMGITIYENHRKFDVPPNDHQKYGCLATKAFAKFYELMMPEMKYFIWNRYTVVGWSKEDWRLYMASIFYSGLEDYELGKSVYMWQRESADMTTLLETLFTADDTTNEEIGYRLRKRVAVLIQWKFPEIETEIKNLYKDRSEFVHGGYYKKIYSEMRRRQDDNVFPLSPNFEQLYKMKERIRFILIAYIYLHKIMVSQSEPAINEYKNVQELLEAAIINTNLKSKINKIIRTILKLVPSE